MDRQNGKRLPHQDLFSSFYVSDFRIKMKPGKPAGKRFLKDGAVPSIFVRKPPVKPRPTKNSAAKTAILLSADDSATPFLPESEPCIFQSGTSQTMQRPDVKYPEQSLQERVDSLEGELLAEKWRSVLLRKERDHVRGILQSKHCDVISNKLFLVENFKDNDADICFYTGFPSYAVFQECYHFLDPVNNIVYHNTKGQRRVVKDTKLMYEDQFFLTLVRLRLGLLVKDLSHRFKISVTSVNRYFVSWVNFMYLKLGSLDIWPTKAYITQTMPESMKEKFPNLEWIIDAFEIQIQRPSSLTLQSQSYSTYKSRNIVKGLVACTPSGQIGFISQLYTGNISDREITVRSGFLDMAHTKGAMWLVDKGFQIADLAQPLGVTVNMPAFVGNRSQMTADEVFHTQSVASERIHVERAINKIKSSFF
jgi:hypothetical protein